MTAELQHAARALRATRSRLKVAMAAAENAAMNAHANGTPETEIARTLGVNRMTVRRWLGKMDGSKRSSAAAVERIPIRSRIIAHTIEIGPQTPDVFEINSTEARAVAAALLAAADALDAQNHFT